MRYAFVASQRTRYPVSVMCRVLEVSSAGFYAYLKRCICVRPDPEAALRAELCAAHRASRRSYGRPRLVRALRERGHGVGPKRVRRLMREAGIEGVRKRPFKPSTTHSAHARPVAPNVLDRRFEPNTAPPAWVSDITYLATLEGWMYLATVIEVRTRRVLGYSLADRMFDTLVRDALANACITPVETPGVIFHSDRGSQYASGAFGADMKTHGLVPSMSRTGNCWDNAVAESFFSTLKAEEATAPYLTKAACRAGIASYIHGFYNPIRLHSTLGYRSPNDYARTLEQAT